MAIDYDAWALKYDQTLFSRLPAADRRRVLAAIRRNHYSGRLRDVIVEYETFSVKGRDGAIFIARL